MPAESTGRTPLEAFGERRAPPRGIPWKLGVLGASIVGVLLVAVLDHLTGIQIRIFPLYYLPIAASTYLLSLRTGLFVGVLSAACWLVANWVYAGEPLEPVVWTVNTGAMILSFSIVSLLISRLGRAVVAERNLARRDPLTGLPNGRAFLESAELLFNGACRYQKPFTIAYFDLDSFKVVNDQRGHHEGDLVLRRVGSVLRRCIRSSDLVARIGGDEFVAMLPSTDAGEALTLLERVRAGMSEEMARGDWPVTMSVGAAAFSRAPETLEEAIRAADDLMYQVKRSGKNRVCVTPMGR